ncbi:MAG: hypothetical protein AAGC88_06325, partial [Bacteroidota bacterium]
GMTGCGESSKEESTKGVIEDHVENMKIYRVILDEFSEGKIDKAEAFKRIEKWEPKRDESGKKFRELLDELSEDGLKAEAPEAWAEFEGEVAKTAEITAKIEHPGVVRIHDLVEEDGRLLIVMG